MRACEEHRLTPDGSGMENLLHIGLPHQALSGVGLSNDRYQIRALVGHCVQPHN